MDNPFGALSATNLVVAEMSVAILVLVDNPFGEAAYCRQHGFFFNVAILVLVDNPFGVTANQKAGKSQISRNPCSSG